MASLASARRSSASITSASASASWSWPVRCRTPCTRRWVIWCAQRLAFQCRLARNRLGCKHDVAQHGRQRFAGLHRKGGKGQHVGRLVLAAPGRVELPHMRIVGKDDAELRRPATSRAKFSQRRFDRARRPCPADSASVGQSPASTSMSICTAGASAPAGFCAVVAISLPRRRARARSLRRGHRRARSRPRAGGARCRHR